MRTTLSIKILKYNIDTRSLIASTVNIMLLSYRNYAIFDAIERGMDSKRRMRANTNTNTSEMLLNMTLKSDLISFSLFDVLREVHQKCLREFKLVNVRY